MGLGSWLKWLPLSVAPILLASGVAAGQEDNLCFMQTSSGQRVSLEKFCGKSGEEKMSDLIWDETNYDAKYVTLEPNGMWNVVIGAPHPFRYPDGSVLWPDGRVTEADGHTSKLVTKGENVIGVQYYQADGKTPLKSGEATKLPTGQTVTQQGFP
jgi:hypothetical protein